MNFIDEIIGKDDQLTSIQMGSRAMLIFFVAYVLIRISGRRSFNQRSPLDNIIVILLGAILSRAVVGASPFFSVITSCIVIVVLHRFLAWLMIRFKKLGKLTQGRRILLYSDGHFFQENMNKSLLSQEEIRQALRSKLFTESLAEIDAIYMEANGEISFLKNTNNE